MEKISSVKFSSWFVGEEVLCDGSMLLGNRIDPLFLMLSIMAKVSDKFAPLDQIFTEASSKSENDSNSNSHSHKYSSELLFLVRPSIEKICDVNDCMGDDMLLYRLNEGKVLNWLKKKVSRTEGVLATIEAEESQILLEDSNNTNFSKTFNFGDKEKKKQLEAVGQDKNKDNSEQNILSKYEEQINVPSYTSIF